VFITYLLPSYGKHGKIDKMLPKAAILSLAATISRRGDTSIAESLDADLQPIIRGQLQLVIDQLQGDNVV